MTVASYFPPSKADLARAVFLCPNNANTAINSPLHQRWRSASHPAVAEFSWLRSSPLPRCHFARLALRHPHLLITTPANRTTVNHSIGKFTTVNHSTGKLYKSITALVTCTTVNHSTEKLYKSITTLVNLKLSITTLVNCTTVYHNIGKCTTVNHNIRKCTTVSHNQSPQD